MRCSAPWTTTRVARVSRRADWGALVRAGAIRGVPLDPGRTPYELGPTAASACRASSSLFPLPTEPATADGAARFMIDTLPPALAIAAAAAFGAVVGSFLNVVIYRLPLGKSIVWPSSACPHCTRELSWYENIPVASFLALRGRCRTCRARISLQYPLVEALTAVMFGAAWWYYGPGPLLASRLVFGCALIVLFAIDLEHQLLPNAITLPGIVVGFLFSFFTEPGWVSSLIGILVGGGVLYAIAEVYYRVRHEEGLGMGDVKMLAMVGAFLGWQLTLLTLMLASLSGTVIGLALIVTQAGRDEVRAAVRDVPRARRRGGGDRRVRRSSGGIWGCCDHDPRRAVSMNITPAGYSLLLLTALVGCLAAVVMFALLRFVAAARDTRRHAARRRQRRRPLLSAALQEAVAKLKAQERATAARAEASERLSGEIISSLTSGLLVVGLNGAIRILNPAGRRILALPESLAPEEYRRAERERPLLEVIDECLQRRDGHRPARGRAARRSRRRAGRHVSRRRRFAAARTRTASCTARSASSPI